MEKFLVLDAEKCRGCLQCVMACSFAKEWLFSLRKARISVIMCASSGMNIPMVCLHCARPLCADICPVGAIRRDETTGAVVLDSERCIGCRMCMIYCPLGGPSIDAEKGVMLKCDLCGGDPECVKHCLHGGLTYVTADEANLAKRRAGARHISELIGKLI